MKDYTARTCDSLNGPSIRQRLSRSVAAAFFFRCALLTGLGCIGRERFFLGLRAALVQFHARRDERRAACHVLA